MSQVISGITWICRKGFTWFSTKQLKKKKSVNLPRNHRRLYVETLLGICRTSVRAHGMFRRRVAAERSKEIAQRFTQGLRNPLWNVGGLRNFQRTISRTTSVRILKDCSEDSRRWFCWLDSLRTPKDCSEDSRRQFCRRPKDNFADSRKTILQTLKDDSTVLTTDNLEIFAQVFMESRDVLLWKSSDFRK